MKTYNSGFYTLMDEAGLLNSQNFSLYIDNVLGYGNTQALKLDGFSFEPVNQLDFDYRQLQIENQLKVMATYTDKDSEAIPFGTKGFESSYGVIPRQKARAIMDEDDYRKYLIAVQQLSFSNMTAKQYALDILFNKLSEITSAHETAMTYQRDQMVSNRGLTLSATNNPRGIKGLTFSASVPDTNVTTLTSTDRWFTDAAKTTEGSTAKPVNDIRTIVRNMKRKGFLDITCEVDEVSWEEDMNHSEWQIALGYAIRPDLRGSASNDNNAKAVAASATDAEWKAAFERIIGCRVRYSQSIVGTETLSSGSLVRTSMRSFNANTYVFYPTGDIGTIKVVAPLVSDNSAIYGSLLGGKGIISYEYDAKAKTQDWWSELTALCVPNRSNDMYYLITR